MSVTAKDPSAAAWRIAERTEELLSPEAPPESFEFANFHKNKGTKLLGRNMAGMETKAFHFCRC